VNTFCVECGKETDIIINGMCPSCFLKGRELTTVPLNVDVYRCTQCSEFQEHGDWFNRSVKDAVSSAAVDSMSVLKEAKIKNIFTEVKLQDVKNYEVKITSVLEIGNTEVEDTISTVVRIKNSVCKRCSRKLGNYYECTLQIRYAGKNLPMDLKDEVLVRIVNSVESASKSGNRDLFITKMEDVTGGTDILLSSMSFGRAMAKGLREDYCAESNESAKLVGRTDDGVDMYRLTFLIRLPEFQLGDVVIWNNRYYKLINIGARSGKLLDLQTFRETTIKKSDMPSLKVYEKASEIREAIVVYATEDEVQVVDPTTNMSSDIMIPSGTHVGDNMRVVNIEDVLYYVP